MDQATVYHPALVAAARRRCTALHLLRTAVPFRSRSVPAVVVAAAVAPFMPVAAFADAAFASSVSVLDVKATVRPAHLYDRKSITSVQSLETVVMPPEDAAALRAGLERWRPLVALSLTTGRRPEVLPLRHVLGASAAGICRTLRSLTLAFFSATADDIRALASSCTVLQSLHVTPAVGHQSQSEIVGAVLDSEWGSVGLATLGLSVWAHLGVPPLTAADFKPRRAPLPLSPIVTVQVFTLDGMYMSCDVHVSALSVFHNLRAYNSSDIVCDRSLCATTLLHVATHGVVEGSTIEKVAWPGRVELQTDIDVVAKARRVIKRWRRACKHSATTGRSVPAAPTRQELGLASYRNVRVFADESPL